MADLAITSEEDKSEHGAALHVLAAVLASTSTSTAGTSVIYSSRDHNRPGQDGGTDSRDGIGESAAEGSTLAAVSTTGANTRSSTGAAATAASGEALRLCTNMPSYGPKPKQQHQEVDAMTAAAAAEQFPEHGEVGCTAAPAAVAVAAVGVSADGLTRNSTATKTSPAKTSRGGRAGRKGGRSHIVCKVDDCSVLLSSSKAYYQRHRVCAAHLGAMVARVDGVDSRFCQQCGKFQPLEEFDKDKRSCRSRLKRHNNRRREQRHSKGVEFTMLAMAAAAAQSSGSGGGIAHSAGTETAAAGHSQQQAGHDLTTIKTAPHTLDPSTNPSLGTDDSCNAGSKYDTLTFSPAGLLAAVPPKRAQVRRISATRALEALRTMNAASSNSTSSDFEGENAEDGHQRSPLAVASAAHRKRVPKRPASAGGDVMQAITQHTDGLGKATYQRLSHPGFMAGAGPRCNLFNSLAAVSYAGNGSMDAAVGSSSAAVHALPARGSEQLAPGLENSGHCDGAQAGGLSRFAPQPVVALPPPYGQQQWQQQQPNLEYPNIGLPRFDDCSGWGRPQQQQQQQQQWPGHQQQQQYPAWEMPRAEQQRLQHLRTAAVEGLPATAVEGDRALQGSTAAPTQQYVLPDGSATVVHDRLSKQSAAAAAAAAAQAGRTIAEQHRVAPKLHSTGSGTFFATAAFSHCGRYSDIGAPVAAAGAAAAAAGVLNGRQSSFPGSWVSPLPVQPRQQQQEEEVKMEEHMHELAPGYRTDQMWTLLHCGEPNHHYQQQQQQQQADTAVQAMPTAAGAAGVSAAGHGLCESSSQFANQSLQLHQQPVPPHAHGTFPGHPEKQQSVHPDLKTPGFVQTLTDSKQLPAAQQQQQQQQQISSVPVFSSTNSDPGVHGVFSPRHTAPSAAAAMPAAARGLHAMVSPFARAYATADQQWQQQQQQGVPGYGMANPGFSGSDHDHCGSMYSGSGRDRGDPRFSAAGSETFSATGVLRSDLAGINLGSGAIGSVQSQLQHQQCSSSWAGTEQQHNGSALDMHQQHLETAAPAAICNSAETAAGAAEFSRLAYTGAAAAVSAAAAAAGQGFVDPNLIQPPPQLSHSASPVAEHQAIAAAAAGGGGGAVLIPDTATFTSMSADEDFGELLELLLECNEQH